MCQKISMDVMKRQEYRKKKDKNETVNDSLALLSHFHWF